MLRQRNSWGIYRALMKRFEETTGEASGGAEASSAKTVTTFFGRAQVIGVFSILVVILLDQLSKWYVMSALVRPLRDGTDGQLVQSFWQWWKEADLPSFSVIQITDYFNLTVVWNRGVSFGLFSHDDPVMAYILIATAAIVSLVLLIWMVQTQRLFMTICFGAIIGGALGNIIDRVRYGAVFDFLDVHYQAYHWPSFNVADMAITVCVVLLVLESFFPKKQISEEPSEKGAGSDRKFVKSHRTETSDS